MKPEREFGSRFATVCPKVVPAAKSRHHSQLNPILPGGMVDETLNLPRIISLALLAVAVLGIANHS
jgi:hypothetical protein